MIRKLFRQMLLTQIVSSMTVTICMLIDSIMIGRFLGVDAMSAYGFASPLLLVFAALGSMISSGIQVMCGKTMARGDHEATNGCYTIAVFLAAAISLVGLAVVFLFLNPLTRLLGAGQPGPGNPVFGLTKNYIVGFILGAPAFLCAQIMVPFMQLSGCRNRLVAAVAAMTLADVVFDLLNVFVFHGGTLGMGLASTLSYYIALVIGGSFFLKKDCVFRLRPRLIRRNTCRELVSYGVPTVVNQISMVLLVLLLNRILAEVAGTKGVAAYSVISTVGNLCYCFGSGTGSVGMMLGASFYADRDRSSIQTLVQEMTRSAVLLDIAVTGVVLLAAEPLITLFLGSQDLSAKSMAVAGLRLFVLSILPSSLNSSFKNYYQGVNRLRLTELISALQNFAYPILFAFLLSRFWGVTGVWLCFLCGETAALLTFSVLVWRHNKGFSLSADAYSMLEPDFDPAPESCFERSLQSVREAAETSAQVQAFCLERGLKPRDAMLIGLCVEEIANNIITHGFSQDRQEHNVDVRLVLEQKGGVIRIRDNCVNFDPTKYLELHCSDDPSSHFGLRMVMGMVKEANYVNSLGLNNLTLLI